MHYCPELFDFRLDLNEILRVDMLYIPFSIWGDQSKIKQLGILDFDCLVCREPVNSSVKLSASFLLLLPLGFSITDDSDNVS